MPKSDYLNPRNQSIDSPATEEERQRIDAELEEGQGPLEDSRWEEWARGAEAQGLYERMLEEGDVHSSGARIAMSTDRDASKRLRNAEIAERAANQATIERMRQERRQGAGEGLGGAGASPGGVTMDAPPGTPPGAANPPQTGSTGLLKETVQSRSFDDPVIQEMHARLAMAADEARRVGEGYRGQGVTAARQMARDAFKQKEAMESMARGGEQEAREHLARMTAMYDEADVDLASLRVDPQRWEEDTPAMAQVLMGLASAAFSFFSGGKGANPVVQLIEHAIDRDMKAQMKNIDLQMNKANLGIEKEAIIGKLEGNLRAAMWERGLNTYEQILTQGSAELQTMESAAAYQEMVAKTQEALMNRLEAYKVTTVQEFAGAGGAGRGKMVTPAESDKIKQDVGSIKAGLALARRLNKFMNRGGDLTPVSSNRLWAWFVDQEGPNIDAKLTSMFRRLGRADGVDVGNLSEKEGEMMVAAGKGKAWDHGPESLVTLNLFINQAIAGYEAKKDTLVLHDQQQWGSWDNLIYGAEE